MASIRIENPDNSMIQIAYEEIAKGYFKGKYLGIDVILNDQGWINVTKLCKEGGKEFKNWKANEQAKRLMEYLSSVVSILTTELLVLVNGGDKNLQIITGTYAHPKLVPHIASWISEEFAIKVSDIVNDFAIKQERQKHEAEKAALRIEKQDIFALLEAERRDATAERQASAEFRRKAEEDRKKRDLQFEAVLRLNGINVEMKNKIISELADTKVELTAVKQEAIKTNAELLNMTEKAIKNEAEILTVKQENLVIKQDNLVTKQELAVKSVKLDMLNEKVDIIAKHNYVPELDDYEKQDAKPFC